jgi:hypothetical protein
MLPESSQQINVVVSKLAASKGVDSTKLAQLLISSIQGDYAPTPPPMPGTIDIANHDSGAHLSQDQSCD